VGVRGDRADTVKDLEACSILKLHVENHNIGPQLQDRRDAVVDLCAPGDDMYAVRGKRSAHPAADLGRSIRQIRPDRRALIRDITVMARCTLTLDEHQARSTVLASIMGHRAAIRSAHFPST
jgi:hypothetical protein